MPSLFNRRSRSVSTSRPTPPASNSAQVAAAQAFLANRQPQSNLSSAAAAAALRTMSPAPTTVGQVQTKRMMNRRDSNSSLASAQRGRGRPMPQRSSSSSSMTERTFRSPSPGRASTSQGFNDGVARDTARPPVPSLPQIYATEDIPPIPKKSHRRSTSMEAPPPRVTSPPPAKPKGRGISVDRAPASSAATTAARRSAGLQQINELERTDSRNSINFSYPRGSRPSSPPPRSPTASNAPIDLSTAGAADVRSSVQNVAQPVKKKKKKVDSSMVEGQYLQAGTVGSKPSGTPSNSAVDTQTQSPTDQPIKKNKKKVEMTGENTHFQNARDDPASGLESDSDATSDLVQERRNQRASGTLLKQPSLVREDWEGEQEEQSLPDSPVTSAHRSAVAPPSRKSVPAANMSRKIEESASSPKTSLHDMVTMTSPKTPATTNTLSPVVTSERPSSLSPSRSTRFSDRLSSDLASGQKHEPLPRSVSPAKSALKHHSPSRSDASPIDGRFPQRRGSSVTPSESSDLSADGASRRKKSARVSFEATHEVVGTAPDVERDDVSQKDTSRKPRLGFGKQKPERPALNTIPSEDDLDTGMKPRPALPLFGSVRKNRINDAPNPPNVKPAGSSTTDTSISSDQAIGGLLANESATRSSGQTISHYSSTAEHNQPSDSDESSSDDDGVKSNSKQRLLTSTAKSHEDDEEFVDAEVPVIAIQPATPGLEEILNGERWGAEVPGGFPASDTSSKTEEDQQDELATPKITSGLGFAEEEPSTPTTPERPQSPSYSQLVTIAEETDNDSVYSDAAEDLADIEGDGFGSINAIVGSPMVSSPTQRQTSPTESPSVGVTPTRQEHSRTASWDDTQSHWSGLAQQLRSSVQQPKTSSNPAAEAQMAPRQNGTSKGGPTLLPSAPLQSKPKKKSQSANANMSSSLTNGTTTAALPEAISQSSPYPILGSKRSSMTKPEGSMSQSLRNGPKAGITSRERPQSVTTTPTQPRAVLQKQPSPALVPRKPVQRTMSNDSDSDSSFKKARRNRKAADGRYTMKRSMRDTAPEPERAAPPPNGRNGVRSMSPVNRRPLSPIGGMRMSMRGSQDLGAPTLRGQPEKKRSSSLFSRARKAKSPTRPAPSVSSTPKLKSRFTDSDDEKDEPRNRTYRSRFADSSDEDEPEPMRPVRGIPKKKDEGDSTDLEDSSDDQRRKSKSTPKRLEIQVPPPSQHVEPEPMSPTTAKKMGFWDRLRGKKKNEAGPNSPNTISQRNGVLGTVPASKTTKQDSQLGFNSTAEREALIEQTRLKLEAAKERPTSPTGKLQRRHTPQRVFSDSWPLPPKVPGTDDDRPSTSDGIGKPDRPGAGDRQPTSDTLRTAGGTAVYGRSGKKKKFPMLRKAFGLHD